MDRTRAHRAAALLVIAATALCGPAPATAGPSRSGVRLSVDRATLPITGQCNGGELRVRLTNRGPAPVYADAVLTAPAALHLPRRLISTWLPAGYTRTVPVAVSAPAGTPTGTYTVSVTSGEHRVAVPVVVSPARPSADLARSAVRVSASSSRTGFPVCGAVDGDADPAHWGHGTGWADGTGRQWPDWYELTWSGPRQPARVTLTTVGSAQFPTARYGLRDWDVQLATAAGWRTVAAVRGNTAVTVTSTFPRQRTGALRIVTHAANGLNDQSRIVELSVS
ncbi:hypothetical protein [Actinoplanes auranticolor]|uniref:F5/8 type C domain-containing protein n=1 Tax=Actinoplanes auranticolor TaxID=47988 RepID=A0A919S9L8_9ACTN|nr:hypothetical protein [Actinoplanes auranticolor]GIM67329.1 hypothetical protein Aau02nite_26930 [Actinoplanes auranticolor]